MNTTHKIYSGTPFDSLPLGAKFKSMKASTLVFTKVKPSMDPHQHNAVCTYSSQTFYDWFDLEETVHVQ